MRRFVQFLAYAVARTIECAVVTLPIGTAMRLGRGLGLLAWVLDRRHRRTALANIRLVYGDRLTPAAARDLARRSFMHLGSVAAETLQFSKLITLQNWERHAAAQGYGVLRRYVLANQGVIVVTAHLGNWELPAFICAVMGFPAFSIARPPSNPFIARRLRQLRLLSGQELIDKRGAMAAAEETLRNGGMLGFLADQYAGQSGVWVNFLGHPASTHKAIGLLSLTTGAPILVMHTYRYGRGFFYVIRIEETIDPAEYADDPKALEHLTQRYTDTLGRAILAHPDQWLWAHRRWRERRPRGRRARKAAAMRR